MKRLFLAVKITASDKFFEVFERLQQALSHDKIKWVNPENIHLTLKFFGETPEEEIEDITGAVDEALLTESAFQLHLRDVGIFGSSYKPRVIWFGIEPEAALKSLYFSIRKELEEKGYTYDRQNFVPHLTVGRIKQLQNRHYFQKVIERFKNTDIQKERIDQLILYESILKPQGPEYNVVEEFALNKK